MGKYERFIKLLNFSFIYDAERVFKDIVCLFAISLINKISYTKENIETYQRIYNKYSEEEQIYIDMLTMEIILLLKDADGPTDILGDIYKKVSNNNSLTINNTSTKMVEFGKKIQGIISVGKNKKGNMLELNCGSGGMILAYVRNLKLHHIDYKRKLNIVATDLDLTKVYMTYIQLSYFEISAVIIQLDSSNNEKLKLYTPSYFAQTEMLNVA